MNDFFGIHVAATDRAFSTREHADRAASLDFLRPKPCPVPLMRIGGTGDGAYLVPDDLQDVEACFSPGVNNYKYFEDSLLGTHGIVSHMCDRSSDVGKFSTPLIAGKQTFLKKWLDITGADDAVSLQAWLEERAPSQNDLLLQIDIEGAEYRNLLAAPRDVLRRFRIILIELHGLDRFNDPDTFSTVLGPFIEKLATDFVCVHAHPNNTAPLVPITGTDFRVPDVLELTLLRRDRMDAHPTRSLIAPQLPHPLDIPQNVPECPPVFLDPNWLDAPRSFASRWRMIQIWTRYSRKRFTNKRKEWRQKLRNGSRPSPSP